VVAKGQLSPSVPRAEATVERIGEWMSGLWHAGVQAHLARNREQLAQLAVQPTQGGKHVPA
jgi:simple sugar transport system ATP-binding protein